MRRSKLDNLRWARPLLVCSSVLTLSLGLSGCLVEGSSSTTTANSVTNPLPNYDQEVQYTGHIQGVLRDAVTNEPIAGATVSIGFASATTDARGQFLLRDVPVTDAASGTDGSSLSSGEMYNAMIDLRAVNSERQQRGAGYLYPEYQLEQWAVTFSSFTPEQANEQVGENLSGGTYHTAITGLVSAVDPQVGKLSTAVQGTVYMGSNQFGQEAFSPAAGATIHLYANADSHNSGMGNRGRLLDTVTADGKGKFTFQKVQANQDVRLLASSADGKYVGEATYTTASGDGAVLDLNRLNPEQGAGQAALTLQLAEQQGAVLVSVSPEHNVDLDPTQYDANAPLQVRFTFNQPIAQNAYARALDAATSAGNGLYDDVVVRFEGPKASNIPFSLEWSADYRSLIVKIPSLGVSSRYLVDISGTTLVDAYGRVAVLDANHANASPELRFTTRGGLPAGQPVVAVTNAPVLDADSRVVLNWAPVAGAKRYRVYREMVQLWNDGTAANSHGYVRLDEVDASGFIDFFAGDRYPFVENDNVQLAFNYRVAALNSDGLEGPWSEPVRALDVVAPELRLDGQPDLAASLDGSDEITLQFDEPLRHELASDPTNYAVLGDVNVTLAHYDAAARTVRLFLDQRLQIEAPVLDDMTQRWGRISTGSENGIVWSDPASLFLSLTVDEHYTVESATPPRSTGVCMQSNASGEFFSRNSDDYADNGYVIPGIIGTLNTFIGGLPEGGYVVRAGDVWHRDESGRVTVYTGDNRICNTPVELINGLGGPLDLPLDAAELNAYASAARARISSVLVSGASFPTGVQLRLTTRDEALREVGLVQERYLRSADWSNHTLRGATLVLGNHNHYFFDFDGTEVDGRNTVSDHIGGDGEAPLFDNYAWRPATSNRVAYTVRPDVWDMVQGRLTVGADQVSSPSILGEPRTELVTIVQANNLRDIAGNVIAEPKNRLVAVYSNQQLDEEGFVQPAIDGLLSVGGELSRR